VSAWFAGPKAENAPWFNAWLGRIAEDYAAWRRNYFSEDAIVVDSALRRRGEPFADAFEDRLLELLARLKADVPFHSPRYAAHMLAEQTLPGIAGYFAAMLYNPNNVASEVAPVTVRLELEAGRLLSRMISYDGDAWAHLCSGGTAANFEALWVARTVKYLPLLLRDVRQAVGLPEPVPATETAQLLGRSPGGALESYAAFWRQVNAHHDRDRLAREAHRAALASPFNVADRGVGSVCAALGSAPVILVPETHHYCFEKAADLLGLGRRSLRFVPVDEHFRVRPEALELAIDDAEREGLHVLAVVAVVGSTEEGSVDPVDRILALRSRRESAERSSFWLHADGAYGGYLRTVTIPARIGLGPPTTRTQIDGRACDLPLTLPEHGECAALEQLHGCDSVTIDPHKLGYIPYPAGAICFRSNLVKPLVRQVAPYLGDAPADPDTERKSEAIGLYALEGSKPGASAAAVWLSHTLIPLDSSGHGRLIRENIRNACELHALLETGAATPGRQPGVAARTRAVCLCPPGSNIVCYAFRPVDPGYSLADVNRLNRAIYARFSPPTPPASNGPPRGPTENAVGAGWCGGGQQPFFVSRTSLSPRQYSLATVGAFLDRLGVDRGAYCGAERLEHEAEPEVFLLRSVLMNPWYGYAKDKGRYYVAELAEALFAAAEQEAAAMCAARRSAGER